MKKEYCKCLQFILILKEYACIKNLNMWQIAFCNLEI